MDISELAKQLVVARRSGVQIMPDWPDSAPTLSEAMAVQSEAFKQFESPSVGWKVGATNKAAQDAFGISAPFYGPMAKAGVLENNANLAKTDCVGACEPEYAFKLARDFPAKGEVINAQSASDAVETVHIAIEVIGRCIGNPDFANGVSVAMDFGGNAGFVVGPEVENWKEQNFVTSPVRSKVDGELIHTGNGEPAMGNPINTVVWLAKTLAEQGERLKAGDWISTGTCTPPVLASAGTTYTATFGEFGDVSISFS